MAFDRPVLREGVGLHVEFPGHCLIEFYGILE